MVATTGEQHDRDDLAQLLPGSRNRRPLTPSLTWASRCEPSLSAAACEGSPAPAGRDPRTNSDEAVHAQTTISIEWGSLTLNTLKIDAHFEKDQRAGAEAARHPLAVLLDLPLENERERDASGEHPQACLEYGFNRERARKSQRLVEVLDVDAERRRDEDAGDHRGVRPRAWTPMKRATQAIGELHRAEDQCAGAGDRVGQQPPRERLDVHPLAVGGIDEEALACGQPPKKHQTDQAEQQVFRTQSALRFLLPCCWLTQVLRAHLPLVARRRSLSVCPSRVFSGLRAGAASLPSAADDDVDV